jgi:chromosome segregation ATPase
MVENPKIKTSLNTIQDYISSLEKKVSKYDQDIEKLKKDLKEERGKKNESLNQLEEIENELNELSSVYEELKKQKEVQLDFKEIMRLYVILTEQVLDGNAHIRLLTLLHGKKKIMTKEELEKASGILPAATLRAIFDLRNNGLVKYDDESKEVTLVKRIFE